MTGLLFVAAEDFEFAGMLPHLDDAQDVPLPVRFAKTGHWNGARAWLVANGPGPRLAAEAARAVLDLGAVSHVISLGLCGALDPTLAPSEVVLGSAVDSGAERFPCFRPPSCIAPHREGIIVSQDQVAATVSEKQALASRGLAVEMEAAGVAAEARRLGLPFSAVKAVSDTATENFHIDLNRARDSSGRFCVASILWQAARHPLDSIPELIRLRSRSRAAAQALGGYLAQCTW
jgi:adenosylhomocysteine nucleosidase